jgi:predicted NBD/HSP70 family sugar kinase
MDLAVDIGGTKTLFAVFSPDGKILTQHKMATDKNYQKFLANFGDAIKNDLKDYEIQFCCCAVPGRLDRQAGIAFSFGNLPWKNVPIKQDITRTLDYKPVMIENDAKLAGLSEAILVHEKYKRVLYLTISTGIGEGIIIDGKIDPDFLDVEAGFMVLPFKGKLTKWEDFASGRAIVERFGKKAIDLEDQSAWMVYSKDLALGIYELMADIAPEVVIIGGGVGAHFDKFGHFLKAELKKLENDMVKVPPVVPAQRPEEAVIYGCYEYIKQQH